MTSASTSSTMLDSQVFMVSRAASRVFQLASPKSVMISVGIRSAARASESSGVCLYLNVSSAPAATGAEAALDGFAAADGGGFLGAEAVAAGAGEAAAVAGGALAF